MTDIEIIAEYIVEKFNEQKCKKILVGEYGELEELNQKLWHGQEFLKAITKSAKKRLTQDDQLQ